LVSHKGRFELAKTLIPELIGYFPPPVEDWAWFHVPNTGIAVSLPNIWRIDMAIDMKDWCGKAESGIMSERGGPSIRGIIEDVPGGPKQVKRRFHFMCHDIEENDHLIVHQRFRDHQIPLLNYGYDFSYDAGTPTMEWTRREQFIAFVNTGFILTLRGACFSSYWESKRHIFEQSFKKLVIFEPKEFFASN
jgi:hypothetical protein